VIKHTSYFDYILVGQGLAGSMLYWFLVKEGKKVCVIDKFNPSSSSRIAAGIIHPVTGRRIVKTWMADVLIPFANKAYEEIGNHFNQKVFSKKNILELISSPKEVNDWNNKMASAELKGYLENEKKDDLYRNYLTEDFKKVTVTNSGWLNISKMLSLFRDEMKDREILLEENFDYDSMATTEAGVTYKGIEADKLIFCEGAAAVRNPYWMHLPFLLSKGELLTIRSSEMKLEHIITKTIFILPVGEGLFKAGSTYSWNDLDDVPTSQAKENLVAQLKKIIRVPFEVVDHKAAIRPTVKDRRPFIGLHPQNKTVGIFNGLGTKGVLLAPFFAHHFSENLEGKIDLIKDVDVQRF
jgi:glycine oxidase